MYRLGSDAKYRHYSYITHIKAPLQFVKSEKGHGELIRWRGQGVRMPMLFVI